MYKRNAYTFLNMCTVFTQMNIHILQFVFKHLLQLQIKIISSILWYRVIATISFIQIVFALNCPRNQIFTGKYDVKHIIFISQLHEQFVVCFFIDFEANVYVTKTKYRKCKFTFDQLVYQKYMFKKIYEYSEIYE